MSKIQEILNHQFNIDYNTSATILITLIIFFLGLILQRILSMYIDFIKRKRIKEAFEIALKVHINQIKKQSKGYLDVSNSIKFDVHERIEYTHVTIFSANSFENIGYQQTFEAYFSGIENLFKFNRKLKLKAFTKIWESIRSIDKWHTKSLTDMDVFLEKVNSYNEKRNDALDNHRKLIDMIKLQYNEKNVPLRLGEYIIKLDEIHTNWQKLMNPAQPDIVHKKLVIPTRELNQRYDDLELAVKMNDSLLIATMEYKNQERLINAYIDQFFKYSISFKMYYNLTKTGMKILKK